MKNYLIKFNRPLLINNCMREGQQADYQTVYGTLLPCDKYDINDLKENIYPFLGYLATVHCWSNGDREDFSVALIDGKHLLQDTEGHIHDNDSWLYNLREKFRRKLGLDYSLYLIDIEDDKILEGGMTDDRITSSELMNSLISLAERQKEKTYTVFLFNRPVFVPRSFLWKPLRGHYHLYGITIPSKYDRELLKTARKALAQLAMYEVSFLSGVTPSGFRKVDNDMNIVWKKNGRIYAHDSVEVEEEGRLCQENLNLGICSVIQLDEIEIPEQHRGDYLLSQRLYEQWREQALTDGIISADVRNY